MSDDLPIEFLIAAQIRIAEQQGIPIVIRRRGYGGVGTLLLKINLLNGTARVLSQVRQDDDIVWSPVSRTDPMADADAEKYLSRQIEIDPDIWIVEVEDKQGRPWFPGRILDT